MFLSRLIARKYPFLLFEVSSLSTRRHCQSLSPTLISNCKLQKTAQLLCFHKTRLSESYNHPIMASTSAASESKPLNTNRLAEEKSPYLLQHAHNPVNWYPWGREAFEKAKVENKPIFLSVGYSTCHWCHVMERESFEQQEIADVLNKHYVSIKVDREERPDVDKVYMAYVQRTTGSGGWPMSVFLTPDLEPLFGGTYFPPKDAYGRVGFKSLLVLLAKQWSEQHKVLTQEAKESVVQLKQILQGKKGSDGAPVPNKDSWHKCYEQIKRSFEPDYGGFSRAPKFPQPTNFNFLFRTYYCKRGTYEGAKALEMILLTLKRMAYGGIHDHVGKGFSRYSVDKFWHVPHFEKMLYDQAQLACSYTDAFVVTKDPFYAKITDDILEYVARDLSHPQGGFFSAEDADSLPAHDGASVKKEGAFYVWSYDELKGLIKEPQMFDLFCGHFSVKKDGNVDKHIDHQGEMKNKNVLHCFGSLEETAEKNGLPVVEVEGILQKCCNILYEHRNRRPRPQKDTKIVTAWNGLMISGFAKAGFALKNEAYVDRATKAALFIQQNLYHAQTGLTRCCYEGNNSKTCQTAHPISGFLDDYAFLIRGLIDLYEATLDCKWLEWAETLQGMQNDKFWDQSGGAYFNSSAEDKFIIVRDKEEQDGAEPAGNSVSVHNLLRLSTYLNREDFRDLAEKTLIAYSDRLKTIPFALPEMTSGLMIFHMAPVQIFIAGDRSDPKTELLLDTVRSHFLPNRVLAVVDGPNGQSKFLCDRHKILANMHRKMGKEPAAYVCSNFTCSLPVTDPSELDTRLDEACTKAKSQARSEDSDSD